MFAQTEMIERKDFLKNIPRYVPEQLLDRALLDCRTIGTRECGFAAPLAYKGEAAAVPGSDVGADRDILGVVLEAIDHLVRIAKEYARERSERRALAGFVVAINEMESRLRTEIEHAV